MDVKAKPNGVEYNGVEYNGVEYNRAGDRGISALKPVPGTYALVVALDRAHTFDIGRRGRHRFPAGFYFYAGSALGPGGLARRVERHLRADKRLHWHIDYLLRHARIVAVWTAEGTTRRECAWAGVALHWPGASLIVPRFGASDCRCAAHLVHLRARPECDAFAALSGDQIQAWPIP